MCRPHTIEHRRGPGALSLASASGNQRVSQRAAFACYHGAAEGGGVLIDRAVEFMEDSGAYGGAGVYFWKQ